MFSGIIKGMGTIKAIEDRPKFRIFQIDVHDLVPEPKIGNSVSISGVCLTITKIEGAVLTFEVMEETLNLTNLTHLKVGGRVNVDTPLKVGDEIGGHLIQGHIDGTAQILEIQHEGQNTRMRFWTGEEIGKYLVHKGSIALSGVSLTICNPTTYPKVPEPSIAQRTYAFDVYLLPLTLKRTTLGMKDVSEKVNVEVDFLVKATIERVEAMIRERLPVINSDTPSSLER